jgi:hypothetical protein
VSRRVPSLIKSIVLVISPQTLGASVGATGNSLHAEECLSARIAEPEAGLLSRETTAAVSRSQQADAEHKEAIADVRRGGSRSTSPGIAIGIYQT